MLDHVFLSVSDIERSIAFYTQALAPLGITYIGHPGRVAGTYEWLVNGLPYVLVYRVKESDDLVLIEAIFHTAQQYRR